MGTLAAWLALLAYLGFASKRVRGALASLSRRLGDWSVALALIPFLLATGLRPTLPGLLRMGLYLALPTLWLRLRPEEARPMDPFHVLTILSIWLPLEPDLFLLGLDLLTPGLDLRGNLPASLFELPRLEAPLVPGVDLPIPTLTAILLALYLFTVHRPLDGLGFTFRLQLRDLGQALLGLLAFSAVGLPLGLAISFLRFGLDLPTAGQAVLMLLAGYLLTALPEEILFRGLIQNLLAARLERTAMALPLAALVFGLGHLNNATPRYPTPNWGYVLMATLAGLAYGWVWQRTKKVTASAVTHALVNFVWGMLLVA